MTDGSVIYELWFAAHDQVTTPRRQLSALPRRARDPGAPPPRTARKPARARKVEPEARRQAILDAALSVFAERGFEAARLDDVAARAGVAKGTLYLYFRDKEALFEELVRSAVSPIIEAVSRAASAPDVPAGSRSRDLLRPVPEGGPGHQAQAAAAPHHRRGPALSRRLPSSTIARSSRAGIGLMRGVAERAARQGEFASDAAARYPQLIVAPLILAVIWDGLFARIDPLDVAGLLRAHREVLTGKTRKGSP